MLGDLGSFGVMKPATLPAGEAASAVFSLFFATASGIAPPGGDLPGMDREISHRGVVAQYPFILFKHVSLRSPIWHGIDAISLQKGSIRIFGAMAA